MAISIFVSFTLDSRCFPSIAIHTNRSVTYCHGTDSTLVSATNLRCSNMVTFGKIDISWSSQMPHNLAHTCSFGKGTWFEHSRAPIAPNLHTWSRRAKRKSGHMSENISSGERLLLDEQTLEDELRKAIEEENYSEAAKIRDSIRILHSDGKTSVLSTNTRFYDSFRNGDLVAMGSLWAKHEHVCCVHPGMSGITGYDLVTGSWEFVWADYEFPLQIDLTEMHVHVRGDLGFVTCMECVKTKDAISWGKQFATNVFERIDGCWYISLHHASHVDS